MKTFKRALSLLLIACMLLSCIPAVAAAGTAGTTTIADLEVDQRTTPMGIDNTVPEFRWEMVSDVRGQKQTAYQIVVTDGETTVWDTKKVTSDVSNAIPYEGTALESSTRYTWTVTVWDKDGNKLEPQESWFETGLLNQSEDWAGASFIAPSTEKTAAPTNYTIEYDFQVQKDCAGFIFGENGGQFLMWQVNTWDYTEANGKNDNKVYFRPHSWAPGGACIKEIDISDIIPWDKAFDVHSMKIEVKGTTIYTYIDGVKLDWTYTHRLAAFGSIGFRHNDSSNVDEYGAFDNIKVTNTDTNEVIYFNDFSENMKPFTTGVLKDGWLHEDRTEVTYADVLAVGNGTSAPMFRKEFTVKEDLVSARLYATSLGIYEAYVNGEKAGVDKMAPGWTDYKKYVQYQTYDITDMLQTGTNAIGAVVGNGWYSGYVSVSGNNHYGTDEAFIGQIVLTYADGSVEKIGTDTTWQTYTDGPYVETDNQNGETYDATKEVPGWDMPNFDASAWNGAKIASSSTIKTEVKPESVALVAQPEEPVQEIEYLNATFLAKTGEDTYVYDLGQNISGVVRVNVKGNAGTTMKLRFGEMVYKATNVLYTANLRSAKATDYYTLKGDENGETYQPNLTFHGFRYVEVSGLGYQPDAADITGVVLHSKLDRTGYVETNNALINQLFSNIVWGQRDNYLSIPTDCPQRDERMGWTGDASVFSRTASLNFDIDAFYTKYLRDVDAARDKKTGSMPSIAPIEPHPSFVQGASVWGDIAVIGPWTIYSAYGDTAILEENWDMMTGWIRYYETTKAGSDYLCDFDTYGDWLAISESTDTLYSSSCFYSYVTGLMVNISNALGKTEEAKYYAELQQNIKNAIVKKYVNQETGIISSNSQTAYVLALAFDILPTESLRQKAADNLVARIEAMNWHLSGGFIGIENLLPVLTRYGYNDVAYQLLLTETYPSWLYSVKQGATTMWERWNSYIAEPETFGDVSMNSFNHYSFGAVGAWMYQYAGGIQYDETNGGYKHFTIAPNPNKQLNEFNVELESVYGRIISNGVLDGEAYTLNATVPANTTATVIIPSNDVNALTVDGKPVTESVEGVTYVGTENGKATFEVVSGSYVFTSKVVSTSRVGLALTPAESTNGKTTVNFTINGEAGSYVMLDAGTEAVVSAVSTNPAEWAFDSWSGSVESMENPLTLTVNEATKLTANFRYIGLENLAEGKKVTADSNAGGAPTWTTANLTDGLYIHTSTKNGWTSGSISKNNCNVNLTVDLGTETTVDRVQLYPRTDSVAATGKPASFPRDFTVSVSGDGKDWKQVASVTDAEIPEKGVPYVVNFEATTARYIKINVTKSHDMATDDSVDRVQLAEIGVYCTIVEETYTLTINGNGTVKVNGETVTLPYSNDFAAEEDVTVEAVSTIDNKFANWSGSINSTTAKQTIRMTADKVLTANFTDPSQENLALNKPVSSNTNLASGNTWGASLLTDGLVTGTGYSSALKLDKNGPAECDIWIDIDLGEVKMLDTVVLHPRNTPAETANGKTPSYPTDFTFQVSDDKENWTVVKTVVGERTPDAGEAMIYTLDEPAAGRYVRLHVTKPGLVEDSDLYYRVQLSEEEIYNINYVTDVAFTNETSMDIAATAQAALTATLKNGETTALAGKNFAVTYASSDEKVAVVSETGLITAVGAGEAEITASVTINGTVYTAEMALRVAGDAAELTIAGGKDVTIEDESVSFDISVKNAAKLVTVEVEMTLDTETMEKPVVTPADGWMLIAQSYKSGKLKVILGNNAGLTSTDAAKMMTVTADLTGKTGNASVTINKAKLSVYEGEGEAYVDVVLGKDATATVKVDYSLFDVNCDGIVDQLDLTRTQRHYGTTANDENWNARADVNKDGLVDIQDLILILNHYGL